MEIRAGGRKWLVDAHEMQGGAGAQTSLWEVSFRSSETADDRVEMRWIPRPERLTESVARRLFELAGERLWRDGRTGTIYRIHLVDEGRPGDDAVLGGGRLLVRFRTGPASGAAPYELDHPLGLATNEELEALADQAEPHLDGIIA